MRATRQVYSKWDNKNDQRNEETRRGTETLSVALCARRTDFIPPPPLKPPTQSPTIVPCILPLPPRNITRLLFPDALLLSHSAATRSTDVDFFFDFFFPSLHSRLPQATEIFTSILVTYVERLVNHAPSSIHPLLFYFLFFLQFFFYSSTSVSLDRFSSVINAEQRDRALVTRKWRLTL